MPFQNWKTEGVTLSPPRRLIPLLRWRGTIHRALFRCPCRGAIYCALFSFSLPTPPSTFRLLVSSLPFLLRPSIVFQFTSTKFLLTTFRRKSRKSHC